ncbi:hypothetical protein QBC43DRAFT_270684 [Cladorrhinum sp. PSN259]|nr:hypothetical protein QBC43DRAFT_270684 [Cladorrhinum sp. PSN259]
MSPIDTRSSAAKPPGYADEDHSQWVVIPTTLFTVICPVLFAVRIWARRSTTGVDLGDGLGLVALIFALITNAIFLAIVHYGFGKHSDSIPSDNLKKVLFLWWINQQTYKVSLHLCKVSLLLLYMRIFSHVAWFRKVALGLVGFLIVYMISSAAAGFAQCTPIARTWDKQIDGTCVNIYVLFNTNGVVAMVTDIIILVLPFPLVYRLTLPWAQKLALIPVFGLGAVICVASAMRVSTLVQNTTPNSDRTYDIVATMWTIIEMNLALVCLCLPSVRVLLVKGFPRYFRSAASRSRSSVAKSGIGLPAGVTTWPSTTRDENGGHGWSKVTGDRSKRSQRHSSRLESTPSEEVILQHLGNSEAGSVNSGGINKTVRYEVEFEMLDPPGIVKGRD